jgi:hypothetical protein
MKSEGLSGVGRGSQCKVTSSVTSTMTEQVTWWIASLWPANRIDSVWWIKLMLRPMVARFNLNSELKYTVASLSARRFRHHFIVFLRSML